MVTQWFAPDVAQVKQLAWSGQTAEVCSLGGGPPAALAGALGDRLLVARGGHPGGTEVSARHAELLPCLLLGWASLAACAILPGALSTSCGTEPSSGHACARWECVLYMWWHRPALHHVHLHASEADLSIVLLRNKARNAFSANDGRRMVARPAGDGRGGAQL